MNEAEKAQSVFSTKDRADSLADLTDDEMRALKADGKIIYTMRKSKDGKMLKALDNTIYKRVNGGLVKIGMLNAEGNIVPISGLSKRERSKLKRSAKRAKQSS